MNHEPDGFVAAAAHASVRLGPLSAETQETGPNLQAAGPGSIQITSTHFSPAAELQSCRDRSFNAASTNRY